ncbi:hypothetical protein FVEG_06186 [Fusarium verticillioides 7600]|uniref:Mitochondrial carrier protein n=1 Tax=Gibberella moniliformis (strain M3125 / FGSC 7600) TaxID=334819 RepID=W7ML61_GIBM7|nr:hypothetical protein FVEG_06186 [Fusarium verticillioides 7600]EWG45372.1 hypothetical protein FVEG_06186 [Fusarium verticillioides 7600]
MPLGLQQQDSDLVFAQSTTANDGSTTAASDFAPSPEHRHAAWTGRRSESSRSKTSDQNMTAQDVEAEGRPPYLHAMIAGGIGGSTGDLLMHSLDTVKTRQQGDPHVPSRYTSLGQSYYTIWRQEGIRRGLYGGWIPALGGSFPGTVMFFGTYEWSKRFLIDHGVQQHISYLTVSLEISQHPLSTSPQKFSRHASSFKAVTTTPISPQATTTAVLSMLLEPLCAQKAPPPYSTATRPLSTVIYPSQLCSSCSGNNSPLGLANTSRAAISEFPWSFLPVLQLVVLPVLSPVPSTLSRHDFRLKSTHQQSPDTQKTIIPTHKFGIFLPLLPAHIDHDLAPSLSTPPPSSQAYGSSTAQKALQDGSVVSDPEEYGHSSRVAACCSCTSDSFDSLRF